MVKRLTEKQRRVYEVIEDFWHTAGVSPSVTDIARTLGLRRSTTYEHLMALKKKGALLHLEGRSMSWRPVSLSGAGRRGIPIFAQAPSCRPIEVLEAAEGWIEVGALPESESLFALRVQSKSMCFDGILEGDLVVIRQQEVAEDGDVVLAESDDQVLVSRYSQCDDEVRVLGKIVRVVRDYEEQAA